MNPSYLVKHASPRRNCSHGNYQIITYVHEPLRIQLLHRICLVKFILIETRYILAGFGIRRHAVWRSGVGRVLSVILKKMPPFIGSNLRFINVCMPTGSLAKLQHERKPLRNLQAQCKLEDQKPGLTVGLITSSMDDQIDPGVRVDEQTALQ